MFVSKVMQADAVSGNSVIQSFRFGDIELAKLDKDAIPVFVAGQSYPDLLNIALALKAELEAGSISRGTVLPPLNGRAAVSWYQGLIQRKPESGPRPKIRERLRRTSCSTPISPVLTSLGKAWGWLKTGLNSLYSLLRRRKRSLV